MHPLANDRARIAARAQAVADALDAEGYGRAAQFAVRLSIEEAVKNAFCHGQKNVPDATVDFGWAVSADSVQIVIADHGPGFDPSDVPDPTAPDRIESVSGRGLFLIKSYMTEVTFNDSGNTISMRFENPTHA